MPYISVLGLVAVLVGGNTHKTHITVEEVPSEPLTGTTYPAVIAVIGRFVGVVIPQLTHTTIIPRRRHAALDARIPSLLGVPAQHAEHVLRLFPWKLVVFHRIVAEAAGIPLLARGALHLDIPPVVLATKSSRTGNVVGFALGTILDRNVRRPKVILSQTNPERITALAVSMVIPELERVQRSRRQRLFQHGLRLGRQLCPTDGNLHLRAVISFHEQEVHHPCLFRLL
jgi:hypothetical protein